MISRRRIPGWVVFLIPPVGFLCLFFLWPGTSIIQLGLASDGGSLSASAWRAVWFTVWQSAVSAAMSVVVALPVSWLLYRRRFRGRSLLRSTIMVPFVLPSVVTALAFLQVQQYGFFGTTFADVSPVFWIILAHMFYNVALATRTVGGLWERLDPAPEEAAATLGAAPARVFLTVTLPRLRPGILASLSLIFLFCCTSFGLILILGAGRVRTIETELWYSAIQFLDLRTASLLAIIQTLISVVAFWVSGRFSRHFPQDSDAGARFSPRLKAGELPLVLAASFPMAALIVVPLLTLLIRSLWRDGAFSLDNYANLLGETPVVDTPVWLAAVNSIRNALLAGGLALILALCAGYALSRRTDSAVLGAVQRVCFSLATLPIGISAVVIGFGYLVTFGAPFYLRSSWVMIPIAQALIALPIAVQIVLPSFRSISHQIQDAAATLGASTWQTWRRVEFPLTKPAIQTAFSYALLTSVGEFGAANFLALPQQGTLPTVLYRLISRPGAENFGMAMATSVLLVLLALLTTALASRSSTPTAATPR